jgi:cell division protein FtsL
MNAATPPLPAARSRNGARTVLVVLCALVLSAGALFYLWQRYEFVRLGFAVHDLRARKAALLEQIEPLRVEAHYLSRLERIEALAREKLNLRPPVPSQVIVVEEPVLEKKRAAAPR